MWSNNPSTIRININNNGNGCVISPQNHHPEWPNYGLSNYTGPVSYPKTRRITINPYNPAFTMMSPYQYARLSPYNKYDY